MKRFFICLCFCFVCASQIGAVAQTRVGGPMRDITHPNTYNNTSAAKKAHEYSKTNSGVNYKAIDKAADEARKKAQAAEAKKNSESKSNTQNSSKK